MPRDPKPDHSPGRRGVPRKKPGFFWLFFYGRRRRGFPWLLAVVVGAALVLGLSFALPRGADLSALAGIAFIVLIALLAFGALAAAVYASLRPRRKR